MTPQQQQTLLANIAVIRRVDRALAYRLCLPVEADTATLHPDGTASYRCGRADRRLDLDPGAVRSLVDEIGDAPVIRLVGAGVGELVTAALERTSAQVLLWERDPWLLRLSLASQRWEEALESGRLTIWMGGDIVTLASHPSPVLVHPVLASIYPSELRMLCEGAGARRALLCAGELFVADVAEVLWEQGISVYTWDIHRLSVEELRYTARRLQPELVMAINYTSGLAEACAALSLPLICWEIDPATSFLEPVQHAGHVAIFTYRKVNVARFRAAGFSRTQHLPLAANVQRRKPLPLTDAERERYAAPVSFVGASMVDNAERFAALFVAHYARCFPGSQPEEAHQLMDEALQQQRQHPRRYLLEAILDTLCPALRPTARALGIDDPAMLLGEGAAAEKRLRCVGALGGLGVRVWGDAGWARIAHTGARHMGYAGHFSELGRIYCGSRVNIDIGRLYQPDIVPMRIFDILASGGFVLAEHTAGLEEVLVVGQEIETWSSERELVEKARWYLAHPDQAREIAAAGMARVRADHTIRGRMAHMLSQLAPARMAG